MSVFCCENKCKCVFGAIIVSIIIGIVSAFLQLTAVITVTPAFLWVVLGIAVVYLAVLLVASALKRGGNDCECICATLSTVLAGILITVLFAVVLLGVTFEAGSVIGAIFVGLLLFGVSLNITASACLVKCFLNCRD